MAYQIVTMEGMDSPTLSPEPPAFDRRAWPEGGLLDYWRAPDGWPLRRYRLGPGARGRMLILNGRGDSIEKYLEVIAHWAGRGWAVTGFDWRGQGGSGRLTADPLTGHIEDFGQWIVDLAALAVDWRAQGDGPHVMLGHSMGGHLLLRALAEGAVAPDAAVLVAPMLGLHTGALPEAVGYGLARLMCRLGRGEHMAWTQQEGSTRLDHIRQKRLTHSPERYADELWWREYNRDIALGPPSWRWVERAFASTRALAASPALAGLTLPLLILATAADELVSTPAIRRIVTRLSAAQLHIYGPEAAHEILRELDPVRLDALSRIDDFLARSAP
jgi:lysophospholipase